MVDEKTRVVVSEICVRFLLALVAWAAKLITRLVRGFGASVAALEFAFKLQGCPS
jgi:hypothetical protein